MTFLRRSRSPSFVNSLSRVFTRSNHFKVLSFVRGLRDKVPALFHCLFAKWLPSKVFAVFEKWWRWSVVRPIRWLHVIWMMHPQAKKISMDPWYPTLSRFILFISLLPSFSITLTDYFWSFTTLSIYFYLHTEPNTVFKFGLCLAHRCLVILIVESEHYISPGWHLVLMSEGSPFRKQCSHGIVFKDSGKGISFVPKPDASQS